MIFPPPSELNHEPVKDLGPGLLITQKSGIVLCTKFAKSYMNFLPKRTTPIIIGLYCASRGGASLPAIEKDYSPQRHLPRFLPIQQGYPPPPPLFLILTAKISRISSQSTNSR